ncbi:sulfite exporter TauE/SafE family protein [Kallotenue papyrolyticum]|uniref:sulfite exporter TauE/SafE family protein n=1 Tax=Kallotenue papyrolyticum TaxID=1325125 RepID=UPI0004ACA326|nr:sulfite exporter TauE/SafE family protein [Kallotenue papyrolyticum]
MIQTTLLLAPLLGTLIGLALGMLGGGGSILTVPMLVYLLGQPPHTAIAASLVIVGLNALSGAWLHHRAGHVHLWQALLFGVYGMPAAYVGARLSAQISGAWLLVLFALLMLVIAGLMLRGGIQTTAARWSQDRWWRVLLGGLGVGFLTGFLGVGGGFLIVPALVLLLGMEMPDAVGSSLVVIALNCAAGLLGHLGDGNLPWLLMLLLVVTGLVGVRLGEQATRRLSASQLRRAFALVVVALAVTLLAINVPAVLAG